MPDLSSYLSRAWLLLIALSAGAATLSEISGLFGPGVPVTLSAGGILLLAVAKSRVILARYLGLSDAPGWLSGFFTAIVFWAVIMLGLYLLPVVLT